MKLSKKFLKIVSVILLTLIIAFYILLVMFSAPKSNDEVIEEFAESIVQPTLTINSYKNFEYRVVGMQREIDSSKLNLVFIHGAIGSSLDFKKYMSDSLLHTKANMISYDRVGYNYEDKHLAQKTLQFEIEVLMDVVKDLDPNKTILVGYSYGGPIALAVKEKYRSIVLLAPAVYSEVEPMPWAINLYKWKATRWLFPNVWKSASEEKLSHVQELKKYESNWSKNLSSTIVSIHGDEDGIVPYENSLFLEKQFPEEQFQLVTIPGAGHSLVWSEFDFIKSEFLKLLD